jgi:hypothetical protein
MKLNSVFFDKKFLAVSVIYFLASAVFLFQYGIQLSGEAEKYIDNAHRIMNFEELRNGIFGVFYYSYSIIVTFFIKFSINLNAVAIFQILLSFIAATYLYKLLINITANKTIAFVFFIAYLFCYPIQKWNFFLYSESLHVSLVTIGTYIFHKAVTDINRPNLIKLGIIIIAIFFSRPVGIIFLIAVVMVMMIWAINNKKKSVFFVLLACFIAGAIAVFYSPITTYINPDSIRRMEVICQVSEKGEELPYTEFNRTGLGTAFKVIKNDIGFGNFISNGGKKLLAFFGMCRSYYSTANNSFLILYWLLYPFAIIGTFSKQGRSFNYIRLLALFYVLITSVALIFTCDDWANRFIAPVFPFIILLAAAGFFAVWKRIKPAKY